MVTTLAVLAAVLADQASDPIKEVVLKFLLSYGGLAGGVSFLVEGLKLIFKNWASGKEPLLVILLSFVLGAMAKWLLPDVYGPATSRAWGLHLLILTFVAIGAAAFHDKFLSVLQSFIPKKAPPPSGGGDA